MTNDEMQKALLLVANLGSFKFSEKTPIIPGNNVFVDTNVSEMSDIQNVTIDKTNSTVSFDYANAKLSQVNIFNKNLQMVMSQKFRFENIKIEPFVYTLNNKNIAAALKFSDIQNANASIVLKETTLKFSDTKEVEAALDSFLATLQPNINSSIIAQIKKSFMDSYNQQSQQLQEAKNKIDQTIGKTNVFGCVNGEFKIQNAFLIDLSYTPGGGYFSWTNVDWDFFKTNVA